MNIISRLLSKRDHLLKRPAQRLVAGAHIVAVGSYVQFCERFPVVTNVEPEEWDWVLTVGAVFVGAVRLAGLTIEQSAKEDLMKLIIADLSIRYADGLVRYNDCKAFVERGLTSQQSLDEEITEENEFLFADVIGMWMTWNLLQRFPVEEDELAIIRPLGMIPTVSFSDWWAAGSH